VITKNNIRNDISEQRRRLDSEWLESSSRQVQQKLHELPAFQSANTVALYLAIGGEVNLDMMLPISQDLEKQTCVPVFNSEHNLYEMAEITADTEFEIGNYGIHERGSPTLLPLDQIDLMIVPGVAFDLRGNRLGRGGGYYDRLLDGFPGKSVAVAFDFQLFPALPIDPPDKPVDFIITETKSVKV